MSRSILAILAAALGIALWSTPAAAQFSSSVQGIVADQSGAVVPGATVTARNLETQVAVSAVTNETGVDPSEQPGAGPVRGGRGNHRVSACPDGGAPGDRADRGGEPDALGGRSQRAGLGRRNEHGSLQPRGNAGADHDSHRDPPGTAAAGAELPWAGRPRVRHHWPWCGWRRGAGRCAGQFLDGEDGRGERERPQPERQPVHAGRPQRDEQHPPGNGEPVAQSGFGAGSRHPDQHVQRRERPRQLGAGGDHHQVGQQRLPRHWQLLLHQRGAAGAHPVHEQVRAVQPA